jgi:cytochrome b561
MRNGYSGPQILLHWLIVTLVPVQYLTGGSIERVHQAVHMGMVPSRLALLEHTVHNYCGMSIGAIMAVRLVLRLLRPGVLPANPSLADRAARLLYLGFYAAIIAQASLGFIASYIWFGIATVHVAGAWLILAMVGMHVAAAFWHGLIKKDDVLDRMLPARRAAEE